MAVRKIFVNPGDLIIVHVIDDPFLPKNEREWAYSKPRPYRVSMTADRYGLTFHDPMVMTELYLQQGGADTRVPFTLVTKRETP